MFNIPHHRAKYIVIFFFVLVVAGTIAWSLFKGGESQSLTVTLTDKGFVPSFLHIEKGDTVTFVNQTDTYFWPASDLHPTHAVYAEFDPKEPLASGSSWSFTFQKAGVWKYHDHLTPLYLGEVIVSDGAETATGILAENCVEEYEDHDARSMCFAEQLRTSYENGGIEAGLQTFADLFNKEFSFAEDCHTYTHILGQLAYADYSAGKDFDVTNQVAYCSYGFFHGFMEALVFETGDYRKSREFCDYIEERLEGEIDSVGPCIHGIGHGLTDGSDPRAHGDARKLIAPALAICKDVTRTDYEDKICATGVYNALGELFLKDQSTGILDPNDVYAICREETEHHIKEACYEDLKIVPYDLADSKFKESLAYITSIQDELIYKQQALENLALFHVYTVIENEYKYSIEACRSIDAELLSACIRGLAAGFINSGPPDKEYVRAFDFCASPLLTHEEKRHCYDRALQASYSRYAPEVFVKICTIAPREYQGNTPSGTNYCELAQG
jgi:plastocyanin